MFMYVVFFKDFVNCSFDVFGVLNSGRLRQRDRERISCLD